MGQTHGRLHDNERKTNSSFSQDSDISLSTHSIDYSLTPPPSKKAVSFQ
ncbi:hypothetical protein Pmani_037379, partial [Petrolisthes manimaculis]